jgi:hypothetical protein
MKTRLDRLCEQQRWETLLHHNRFHYRKQSVTTTYWYWRNKGESREIAYKKALGTQLVGLKPCAINLDTRTVLVPVQTMQPLQEEC